MKILITIVLSLILMACEKQPVENHATAEKITVDEKPDDFKVPVQMWDDVETDPVGIGEKKIEPTEDESGMNRNTILFSPLTIILKEHNSDVLSHSEIRIELPRGGGKIDLSKYRGDRAGSFFVQFEWPDWAEPGDLRSFYISQARKRKLDGEIYGVGCNKYLEITSLINKSNEKMGLKFNTTRDRHITALGGHFVFSNKKGRQIFLTQVTFTDSKNPALFCEDSKPL